MYEKITADKLTIDDQIMYEKYSHLVIQRGQKCSKLAYLALTIHYSVEKNSG